MKDAAAPLANNRDDASVKRREVAADARKNGGTAEPQQAMTNGHSDKKQTPEETDAYENTLLLSSDNSDSENLNLELELSDEEGAVSATESTASTIVLSSSSVRVEVDMSVTATAPAEAKAKPDEVSLVSSTVEDDAETPAAAEKSDETDAPADVATPVVEAVDCEEVASSPDSVVVVDESEAIVDPKPSTIAPSAAAAAVDSVSKPEDTFVGSEVPSKPEDGSGVLDSDDANAVRSGDSAVVVVVELDDSVDGKEAAAEASTSDASPQARTEVVEATTDKELAAKPEVQVIDIDDSSSESSKEKIDAGTGMSDSVVVSEGLEAEAAAGGDTDLPEMGPSDELKDANEVGKEEIGDQVLGSTANEVTEDAEEVAARPDVIPENGETEGEEAVETADAGVNNVDVGNADCVAVELALEKSDESLDELALKKDDSTAENISSVLAGEPDDKSSADKSSDIVDPQLSDNEGNSVDKGVPEKMDEGVTVLADESVSSCNGEVSDKEVVGKDEEKVEPTLAAADIVALTLVNLIDDVVNKAERIGQTVEDEKSTVAVTHPQEASKIDDHEVISIADDSNEGSSLSDLDKAKAKDEMADSKGVKDEKLSSDLPLPIVAPDSSVLVDKMETVPDLSTGNASETDGCKTLLEVTPKSNTENITTSEDPPKRPKRSTVLKSEEIANAKRMRMSSGDGLSNSVRSVSKENLNPAQKRGSAGGANDDAKKARLERKSRKKDMSNLDKAIARVASGGMSQREQEIAKLVGQLSSKSMEHITVSQLEDLVQYMIGQYILEQSDCAAYRKEVAQLKSEVDRWQTAAKTMAKQVRDLENVMKKMNTDIKTLDKNALPLPSKVNRSVGLQVGDGRITNEQKKLAIPRLPAPVLAPPPAPTPPSAPPLPTARRTGLMTNRPSPMTATTATATVVTQPRVRAPAPQVTPPKRLIPSGAPVLSPAHRPSNVLAPANMAPRGASLAIPAQPVGSTNLLRRSAGSVVSRTPPGALIDLTDGDESPAPRQIVTAVTTRQSLPTKIRLVGPGSAVSTIATTKQPGTIRLVAQSTLTAPNSARVAYMVPASATGGEPRMYFAAAAPKQQVSMNGGTVISRPAGGQPRQVVFSTNVTQMTPALRGLQPGFRQAAFVTSARPTPGTVVRARPVHVERKMVHPAPLPMPPPPPAPSPGWKKSPPTPELKISKCDKRSRSGGDSGIILSWKMDALCSDHDDIKSYQLYAYQETSSEPSTTMWKRVGEVQSMALPMACTLTQFTEGNKYHFAVRAVDIRGRIGPFSRPGNIVLSSPVDE